MIYWIQWSISKIIRAADISISSKTLSAFVNRDSSWIWFDCVYHCAHAVRSSLRFKGTDLLISFFHFVLNVMSSSGFVALSTRLIMCGCARSETSVPDPASDMALLKAGADSTTFVVMLSGLVAFLMILKTLTTLPSAASRRSGGAYSSAVFPSFLVDSATSASGDALFALRIFVWRLTTKMEP